MANTESIIPVTSTPSYQTPAQMAEAMQSMASLTKLLLEISNYLNVLRREFRGEALFQTEKNVTWFQVTKPTFVKMNPKTKKPIMEKVKSPWGDEKEIYVSNDEAIDEILSILKFAGINQISPISTNSHDNYMDDLREFECKLAALLCLKQKSWGLDKELLPMYQFKIKTIVQDARALSVAGVTLKALITSVQRVEHLMEGDVKKKRAEGSPY